jgi:predicted RNase H-like HicB family nuclease
MTYLVIVENGHDGTWGAYVPDLPGCTAVGDSEAEVKDLIKTSIDLWLATASRHHWPVPPPTSTALTLAV